MASQWRDSREERLARDNVLFSSLRQAYHHAPEPERCELILWIEPDWRCEYWMRGESGAMRLFNGRDTILDVPVTDPIAALQEVRLWHDVVLHGGVPHHA